MRRVRIGMSLLTLVTALLMTGKAQAVTRDDGYEFIADDIQITVNENNTYDVTERMSVNFRESSHGINRTLPLRETVRRVDGSSALNRVQIDNVSSDVTLAKFYEDGMLRIRLGDAGHSVIGQQDYELSYRYNPGKDQLQGADEFYYNIIGTEMNTTVSNVTFMITMPKDFEYNEQTLGFSTGNYGWIDDERVHWSVDGRTIAGYVDGTLDPGEALTVRLTLPDDYFVGAGLSVNWVMMTTLIVCVTLTVIAWWLYERHGRDPEIVESVEFYPPEDLNSAEVGALYEGVTSSEAAVSLLIYLANAGYIRINEEDNKNYTIEKVKDYDGDNRAEKKFFEGLFADGKDKVRRKDLVDKFYVTLVNVKYLIDNGELMKSWRDQYAIKYRVLAVILAGLAMILTYLVPVWQVTGGFSFTEQEAVMLVFGVVLLVTIAMSANKKNDIGLLTLYIGGAWFFWFVEVAVTFLIYQGDVATITMGVGCLLASSVAIILAAKIRRLTSEGTKTMGLVRGFRRFLETAEKNKLEMLVSENPQYFYKILPFTYALGVSKVWVEKFAEIAMSPPDWYSGYDAYDTYRLTRSIDRMMRNTQSAMVSTPRAESSGFGGSGHGGGGGFSGGGHGGGGSSRW